MTIHEFGAQDAPAAVLIHPSVVKWDYFEKVIPLLEGKFHLIVPALPGYDPDEKGDFTSVEEIARQLAGELIARGRSEVSCLYGCSMGGAIVLRMLTDARVRVRRAVADGGITPYQLPWLVTRLIAVRDFLMIFAGKLGGAGLLEKAFSTDEMNPEAARYIAGVLRMMSARTIWRTFDSCNNYEMPKEPVRTGARVQYWYAEAEEKARKWDIRYMKKMFPAAEYVVTSGIGHGGMALLRPEEFAARIVELGA